MLTKLIKYEFRSSGRMIPFVFLAAVLLAGLGAVISLSSSPPLLIISYGLLQLAGSAALVITYVVIFVRFYKGMYGAEGYLAHTIPADAKTLYRSKTIVSAVWLAASTVVTALTWSVAGLLFVRMMETTDDAEKVFADISLVMSKAFTAPVVLWVVLSMILSWLAFLGIVFFCITLSNVKPFSKLGLGSAVLAYLAISFVNQIISVIIMAGVPLSISFNIHTGWSLTNQTMFSWFIETITSSGDTASLVVSLGLNVPSLLFAFVLPVLTVRLMEKKVILK